MDEKTIIVATMEVTTEDMNSLCNSLSFYYLLFEN